MEYLETMSALLKLDQELFHAINGMGSHLWIDAIALKLSALITWWIVAGLILVIAIVLRKKEWLKTLLLCAISVGVSDATCTYLLKPRFQRLRPCYQGEVALRAGSCGGRLGMPSNHAANGAAVVVGTWARVPLKLSLVVSVTALLVGWSRIHLGVHYPGDVIVGWTVGALLALLIIRLKSYLRRFR